VEVRRRQAEVAGGGAEVPVGGDHDGPIMGDRRGRREVDGVVATQRVGLGEVTGPAEQVGGAATSPTSAKRASNSACASRPRAGDNRPNRSAKANAARLSG
jgi:hypothetical protein